MDKFDKWYSWYVLHLDRKDLVPFQWHDLKRAFEAGYEEGEKKRRKNWHDIDGSI